MLEVIDNKYKVVRTLGKGGNGTVYVAWNESLQKEVAIKVLTDPSLDGSEVKRFQKEARALSSCNHPGIVHVSSFGMTDDKRLYYAMDYIEGRSLSAEIEQNGPLSPKRFATIFSQVLSALDHAHSLGLIHRDIKPSNIMLTTGGGTEHAVLIDFGIARTLDSNVKITKTDAVVGTPYYMSPEQCLNKMVDQRADLYSLGCTMLEAATGKPPFSGEAVEVLMAHLHQAPDTVPSELIPLLAGMLAKDPEKRFKSAVAASDCLRSLQLERLTQFTTGKHAVDVDAHKAKRRIKIATVAFSAITVLSLIAAIIVASLPGSEPSNSTEANVQQQTSKDAQWKSSLTLAEELGKQGRYAESAKAFREAISQLEANDPHSKTEQLMIVDDLLKLAITAQRPPSEWEEQAKRGVEIAVARKLPHSQINFLTQMGRLYCLFNEFAKADSAYERAGRISETLDMRDMLYQNNSAYLEASQYLCRADNVPRAREFWKKAVRMLFKQEHIPGMLDSLSAAAWDDRTLAAVDQYHLADDQPFLQYLRTELKRSVTNPQHQLRRYVYRAKFDMLAGDETAAKQDLKKAKDIAMTFTSKPRVTAAWVLHNYMHPQLVSPQEEIALGKEALALCTERATDPNFVHREAVVTAYEHLAGAYERANQFDDALETRLTAAGLITKFATESPNRTIEQQFYWFNRKASNSIGAIYDATRCNQKAKADQLTQEWLKSAAQADLDFPTPSCRTTIEQHRWRLRKAQQSVQTEQ